MGAGVVKPQPGGGFAIHINPGGRSTGTSSQSYHQSQTNSSSHNRPSSNSSIMNCEECAVQFSVFKKKKTCKDCSRCFCSTCTIQSGGESARQCKKCQVLLAGNFTRSQLTSWRIKDLKALLLKNNVNTSKCREKSDLIDLIFRFFGTASNNTPRPHSEHDRLVEQLAERMRQEEQANSPRPTPISNPDPPPSQSSSQPSNNNTTQNQSTSNQTDNQSQQPGPNPTPSSTVPPHGQGTTHSEESQARQQQAREMDERLRRQMEEENAEPQPTNPHVKLDDIKNEVEIDTLTIKELKRLLLNNFVDYKGCVERWELQDRVRRLWQDHETNRKKAETQRNMPENPSSESSGGPPSGEDELCKICMDATIDCVLLECGHMVTCTKCGKQLSECPICRQYVVRAVHTFRS